MNGYQITHESVARIENRDLLNQHYRIHQMYRVWKRENKNLDVLKKKHSIVVSEMQKRGINHTTNLEHAIEALFN